MNKWYNMFMRLNHVIIPIVTILVAWSGSLLTSAGMSWYKSINIPVWSPPGSVIGAVWTTIFFLSTISALIVWNKSSHDRRFRWIIGIFILNAMLNVFWSYLFFSQHLIGSAIFEAAALGLTAYVLIVLIWPVSRGASLLLVPYAGWTTFATYLTYLIWTLNR